MKIYIPSQGRAHIIGAGGKKTLHRFKEATWVVPKNEADGYIDAVRNHGHDVLPCSEVGIGKTKRFIARHAASLGLERIVMCDDDLLFSVRKSPLGPHLRDATEKDMEALLRWTDSMLKKYAHIGISARQGNNALVGTREKCLVFNKRAIHYLGYQVKPFLAMKHDRVRVMEDFDITLQLLRAGFQNALTYWWAQDQAGTGTEGGCSSYRTLEVHNAAAYKLAELHPEFVKIRDKENKTGPEAMRNRKEVTIYWQKAYASSQK